MDIRLSRPCVDDPKRYIAECHFGKRVVIEKLCEILRSFGAKGLKCSVKLGVARFELEERSVMIYSSGRVDIRKIRNTDEGIVVMGQITDMVKEALTDISS
jgi:ArsR family metal-binding transcriptional regulator